MSETETAPTEQMIEAACIALFRLKACEGGTTASWHEAMRAALTAAGTASLSREAALREALEPFIRAAQIIEKRPNDYKDRIAMVGGLGEPADLHKRHFTALLAATR